MRAAIILLFLLLAGGVSLTAQQTATENKKGRGNLSGRVIGYQMPTYNPGVNNAKVFLTRRGDTIANTLTASDGSFVFDSLEPGKYSLRINHPLFKRKGLKRVRVKTMGRNSRIKKPILLRWKATPSEGRMGNSGTVAVSVHEIISYVNIPVDSVLVLVKTMNDSVLWSKMTNYRGYTVFYLASGIYNLTITRPGFEIAGANVDYEEKQGQAFLNTVITVSRNERLIVETVLKKAKKQKEVLLVPVKDD